MDGLNYEEHSLIKKMDGLDLILRTQMLIFFLLLNGNFLLKFIFHVKLYFLDYDIQKKRLEPLHSM